MKRVLTCMLIICWYRVGNFERADNDHPANSASARECAAEVVLSPPAEPERDTQKARLFSLPAELRTILFEYALCEAENTIVTVELVEPPLLRVGKQVREEARMMWHSINRFESIITDCDAILCYR